jgi:hypothetical protein
MRLACQQAITLAGDIAEVPKPVVPEFLGGVVSGVVRLWFSCHDLIQELAVAVLGARFGVGLGHRDRLAEHSARGRRRLTTCASCSWRSTGGTTLVNACGDADPRTRNPDRHR